MSLAVAKRTLDAAVAQMLAPLFAAKPNRRQWRLVDWDCETSLSLSLAREDVVLLVELEARDEARGCHARTARFNVCARRAFDGEPLGAEERRAVDRLVALIREREHVLPPAADRSASGTRAAIRLLRVERVLIAEGAGHYYLNPYVGCLIGCEFCYAAERADLSRELDGQPQARWGRWVDIKIDAPEILRREVRDRPPGIVRLSPIVTDPYQPLERKYRVTRRCLEVLLEGGFTPVVLTRSASVLDDLELLARFPRAAVGLSIPTDDDAMRTVFEPRGDAIDARVEALERFHAAGVHTFAVVQPMLPMSSSRLVERVAPHIRAARVDRMHGLERVAHLYERAGRLDAMSDEFFERTERQLREGFARHGVSLDDVDDLAGLLGAERSPAQLAGLYDRLYSGGEPGRAHAALMSIVGLAPRREVTAVPTRRPPRATAVLRYHELRRIDLVALERGVRPAAKFEDLDEAAATATESRLRAAGLEVVRSAPYRKRFDVPESDDVGASLVNLYASRDHGRVHAIAEAERDRTPEGTRRAGLALGYPPCCVDAFAALERSPARRREGVNELALRAFAGGGAVPWELHPLSSRAPTCFTPCRADCPAALALARSILQALRETDPEAYEATCRELHRPILFFRFPLFWVFEGARFDGALLHYREALANDDGTARPVLQAWQEDELGSVLAEGNALSLGERALEVLRDGVSIARWDVVDERIPLLLRFADGS